MIVADYNNKNGILTWVWGPVMWHLLHSMSFMYPETPSKQDKESHRDFIYSLRYVLPCGKCRENFTNNIDDLPLKVSDLKDRAAFSKWMFDFHNVINKTTKPPGYKSPSFDEVQGLYTKYSNAHITIQIVPKLEELAKCEVSQNRNIVNICTKKKNQDEDNWSVIFWFVIMCISFNYPPEPTQNQIDTHAMFLENCVRVFPKSLRMNFIDCLQSMHVGHMKSRLEFSKQIVKMLNMYSFTMYNANVELNFERVRHLFELFRARCPKKSNKTNTKESGCTEVFTGYNKCRAIVIIHDQPVHECVHFFDYINVDTSCFE